MKLDKAIEILEIHFGGVQPLKDPDLSAAAQLGIEALSRIRYQRIKPTVPHKTLLPSENPE